MRTTLNLDDDVLAIAKSLAAARNISVGDAVSYLMRKGLEARAPVQIRNGFHVFCVDESTPGFGPDEVKAALEADDQTFAAHFVKRKQ